MSKRSRAKNFTEYEKILLVELIGSKVNIIEEKMLTTSVIEGKSKAWDVIVSSFNADEKVNKRDKKHLQGLWKELKARTKKAFAKEKKERFLTGGGPFRDGDMDGILAKVKSLLPDSVFVPQVDVNDDDVITPKSVGGKIMIVIMINHIDLIFIKYELRALLQTEVTCLP